MDNFLYEMEDLVYHHIMEYILSDKEIQSDDHVEIEDEDIDLVL